MTAEQTKQDLLNLPLCEKIRLLPPAERNRIIAQIDALLGFRQPGVLSVPVQSPTKD